MRLRLPRKKVLHFTKSSFLYLHKKFTYLLRLFFIFEKRGNEKSFFFAFKRTRFASDESFLSSSVFFLAVVARIFACHYAISATHYILYTKKKTKNSSPFSASTRVWFIKPLKQWRMHILEGKSFGERFFWHTKPERRILRFFVFCHTSKLYLRWNECLS